jgi:hypothetical protein
MSTSCPVLTEAGFSERSDGATELLHPHSTAMLTLTLSSYAAVFTFRQDLHLSPSQYSWLGSCYFFGYLFFEFTGS